MLLNEWFSNIFHIAIFLLQICVELYQPTDYDNDKPYPYQKQVLHLLPKKAPKLTCFVLYLKIINSFLKINICIL